MYNAIVDIKHLVKAFGAERVVDGISLKVKNGEFLTLLGPSGCGKTTLLRLIAGFEVASSGAILINNVDVSALPPERRNVLTVFQNQALFPHLSVFENVAFGLHCQKVAEPEITARVSEMLALVRLGKLAKRKPHQLSGGQQQRVAIARAIVNRPLVLLLDEPFSALDYRLRKSMQIELKQLQRKLGMTFIFVTHSQEEALSMSDRIAVIDNGKILQLGTPREIYEEPCCLSVANFIGELNTFNGTVSAANEKHLSVHIEERDYQLNNDKGFRDGEMVHVLVRPEDFRITRISDANGRDSGMHGTIQEVIYKGSTADFVIRLESGKLISVTEFFNEDDEDLFYTIGQEIVVDWIKSWEVVLPHEA